MSSRQRVRLRAAEAGDAAAIAALHLRSWQSAYRGMLPDGYIDGGLADDLKEQWRQAFSRPIAPGFVLLAEEEGRLVGFIAIWPETEAAALIDNLHVEPGRRGGGIGRQLLAAAAGRLVEGGIGAAHLWVFAANADAIRFYERLGGTPSERRTKAIFGHPVATVRYGWDDLPHLAAAASPAR